jgi:hypothetical protein
MARAAYQRAQPRYDEPLEAPRPRPRAPQRRSRPAVRDARAYLPRHLFVFVALLALLGAGRVALSFAVVRRVCRPTTSCTSSGRSTPRVRTSLVRSQC